MKKKFGVVSIILMIAGLLVSLCGILGASSEFYAPLEVGEPTITFIHVPEYPNPSYEDLEGNVTGVTPADYPVAVYIRVGDLWWTKPTYASPLTTINPDGTWRCDITTGGNDRYATAVAAYLLPAGVEPPICGPCHELPEIPEAVAHAQEHTKEPRTISFAGYDWEVKRADFSVGPGPNYFSDKEEDVWVDEEGLHLTISERDGKWYCTEVILDTSFGYGAYISQTHGRVDIIDPMMVLGLFTWDGGAKEQNYREMDIEFARWGNADEYTNAQYVVQPCSQCPGCGNRCTRFRANLTDEDSDLTHYFVWNPGTVEFRTYYGKYSDSVPPTSALVHNWTHSSEYVPEPGNEHIRFNFWLLGGNAPTSSQSDEVVISNFSWQEESPFSPVVTSCDAAGNKKNQFAPSDTVYVKASGLNLSTNYKIWIQDDPVDESDILISEENPSSAETPKDVTTDSSGNLSVTPIWSIPQDAAVTYHEYDIVIDKQGDGEYTDKYNAASDGIDSTSVAGFIAPIPELPTIILFSVGLLLLAGYAVLRRKNRQR